MDELVKDLLTRSDNKIMMWADYEYKLVFKTIMQKVLRNYKGVPLEWEDLYYEFLFDIPGLLRKFNPEKGITIKTYLGINSKYFALNKVKSFSTNKHKVLNTYVSIEKSGVESRLNDSNSLKIPMDISMLTDIELTIYNDFYLDGMSLLAIEKNRGISRYKVKKITKTIELKLINQIKN